ncbi:MAG TPA: HD domain-containing protein [Dongiaceae bacterium]|nr:HD domain-containing protein [Dongiaceae bacterium]
MTERQPTEEQLVDHRTKAEHAAADILNHSSNPIEAAIATYGLDEGEQLNLLLAVAPFYMGSPHAKLHFGQVVDVDRYARVIVAMRDTKAQQLDLQTIRGEVAELLAQDKSGHGLDHVDRVTTLALTFAQQEGADQGVVELTSLLHDVDDYKLFGAESAENLTNAKTILERHKIGGDMAHHVLSNIASMGYNNYLDGRRPETLEGAVVSDADMLDAIGAQGIIRTFEYNASKGRPFFVKTIPPVSAELSAEEYRAAPNEHAVQHFFDKLLLVPDILMTKSGQKEGATRAKIMTSFLGELFREEGAENWRHHLDEFLNRKA